MRLARGTRLGPYEILSEIGAGGMGEVYRARDTRLDRTVAVKVLPAQLASESQRRERFQREARVISQLNHPNICVLHDVGQTEASIDFLVMEYLEGETLAARLSRGPLAEPEALRIACEIAGALQKAHAAGIVHRDLKPGNVMLVRPSNASAPPATKLLDFGLAKMTPAAIASTVDASGATVTHADVHQPITSEGEILGTLQYMAPEQLEGAPSDARTDIFALGAMLFEMLTGRRPFAGASQASLIGAILRDEPPAVSALTPVANPMLDRVVRTCLAKDPADRFQTAHDLLLQLRWLGEGPGTTVVPSQVIGRSRSTHAIFSAAALLLGLALGATAMLWWRPVQQSPLASDALQFIVAPPERSAFVSFAISPDGRQIAFVTVTGGVPRLWVRPVGNLAARALDGTDNATNPFWSPDSRSIGFFADRQLKRVQATGGAPVTICDAPESQGGSWSRDDVIVFAPQVTSVLHRVSASGGQSSPITTLDDGATAHRWPWFLPDGRRFFYTAFSGTGSQLHVGSIDSAETRKLGTFSTRVVHGSGHLLFARDGGLMAQAFDDRALALVGAPFSVAQSVGGTAYSVSAVGVLGYRASTRAALRARLTWLDRSGKVLSTVGAPRGYSNISLSLDERRVAASLWDGPPGNNDIWLFDLTRDGAASRLTTDAGDEFDPLWSPDAQHVFFNSNRFGNYSLFRRAADGSGGDEVVVKMPSSAFAPDVSPDGRYLVFNHRGNSTATDLWTMPSSRDREPSVFLQTTFDERNPVFSPDGRWISYDSNVLGHRDVYIRPFPPVAGPHLRVSYTGGVLPRWRGDGRELYFVNRSGTLMTASIDLVKKTVGDPRPLFDTSIDTTIDSAHQYGVSRDGTRFLMIDPINPPGPTPITMVVNWLATAAR